MHAARPARGDPLGLYSCHYFPGCDTRGVPSHKTVAPGGIGIVQIAQGCLGRCTYCITRRARGPLASFPEEEIREKVRSFIGAGVYEIQLTAQDVSAYGREREQISPAFSLPSVILQGNYRLRIGMMNPATVLPVLDDLVDAYASDRIFRFVHLPFHWVRLYP